MAAIMILEEAPRDRLALLLQHFSELEDTREPWRVMYPLSEVLLLVVCATIAACDDFDDITSISCAGSRPSIMAFRASAGYACCSIGSIRSSSSAASRAGWPPCGRIARTSSPSTARPRGVPMIGAKASRPCIRSALTRPPPGWCWRSVACRRRPTRSPPFRSCSTTWPTPASSRARSSASTRPSAAWLRQDGCQVEIADKIVAHKADYLLALKGNQPNLEAEVADYFRTAPQEELVGKTTVEKGHGRIETLAFTASAQVDWITSERSYPGEPRFAHIKSILKVEDRTEYADKCTRDERFFICSAPLDIERLAHAARGHWGVESMHWLLDCEFAEDLSRYRSGHGAKNMAAAAWDPEFLLQILQPSGR